MNREGNRCGRASALFQFVCDHHGAKAPLSIKAGKERMAALVEPALDVLFRATCNAPPCEVCGRSDADRDPTAVRAAGMILDRCGYHPSLTIQQQPAETVDWARWLTDSECEALSEMIDRAKKRMTDGVLPGEAAEPLQLNASTIDADSFDVPEDDETPNAEPQITEPQITEPQVADPVWSIPERDRTKTEELIEKAKEND
jgi:hypothetical protein